MLSQSGRVLRQWMSGTRAPIRIIKGGSWRKGFVSSGVARNYSELLRKGPSNPVGLFQNNLIFLRRASATGNFSTLFWRTFRSSTRKRAAQATAEGTQESLSLSGRLKKLSREYGWTAVGVYFSLSVLDFPFCFLLVKTVGTERIGEWPGRRHSLAALDANKVNLSTTCLGELEHWVVSNVARFIPESVKTFWQEYRAALKEAEVKQIGNDDVSEGIEMAGWGVKEAEEKNQEGASEYLAAYESLREFAPLMIFFSFAFRSWYSACSCIRHS
jgi:hypothetical protein